MKSNFMQATVHQFETQNDIALRALALFHQLAIEAKLMAT